MHFDFTITLGNLMTIAVIAASLWRLDRYFMLWTVEHEILIRDYCDRHGMNVVELPTRLGKGRLF